MDSKELQAMDVDMSVDMEEPMDCDVSMKEESCLVEQQDKSVSKTTDAEGDATSTDSFSSAIDETEEFNQTLTDEKKINSTMPSENILNSTFAVSKPEKCVDLNVTHNLNEAVNENIPNVNQTIENLDGTFVTPVDINENANVTQEVNKTIESDRKDEFTFSPVIAKPLSACEMDGPLPEIKNILFEGLLENEPNNMNKTSEMDNITTEITSSSFVIAKPLSACEMDGPLPEIKNISLLENEPNMNKTSEMDNIATEITSSRSIIAKPLSASEMDSPLPEIKNILFENFPENEPNNMNKTSEMDNIATETTCSPFIIVKPLSACEMDPVPEINESTGVVSISDDSNTVGIENITTTYEAVEIIKDDLSEGNETIEIAEKVPVLNEESLLSDAKDTKENPVENVLNMSVDIDVKCVVQNLLDSTLVGEAINDKMEEDSTVLGRTAEDSKNTLIELSAKAPVKEPKSDLKEKPTKLPLSSENIVNIPAAKVTMQSNQLFNAEDSENISDNALMCKEAQEYNPPIDFAANQEQTQLNLSVLFSDSPAKGKNIRRDTIYRLFDPLYESPCKKASVPLPEPTSTDVPNLNTNELVSLSPEKPFENAVSVEEIKVGSVEDTTDETIVHESSISSPETKPEPKRRMEDIARDFTQVEQELNKLKLEINQYQQEKASLELELHQKDEVILKTQGEAQKRETQYKLEIKQLCDRLNGILEQNNNEEVQLLRNKIAALKEQEATLSEKMHVVIDENTKYRKIVHDYDGILNIVRPEVKKIKDERDTVKQHLANLELAFADVHSKYQKVKDIVSGYKENEETLHNSLQNANENLRKHEERYELLKAHAKGQLEKANRELAQMKEKHHSEISKYNTIVKRLEIKNGSIQQTLDQKSKECAALAALCDEMTGNVPQ